MELGFHLRRQFGLIIITLYCNILKAIPHYSSWLGLPIYMCVCVLFGFRKMQGCLMAKYIAFSGKVGLGCLYMCVCVRAHTCACVCVCVHVCITIFGFRKMKGCLVAKYVNGGHVVFAIVMCSVCHWCKFWVDSCCSHFNTILSKSCSFAKFLFSFYIKVMFFSS